MAILHMDGFDGYSAAAELAYEYTTASSITFTSNTGRFGGGTVKANGYLAKTVTAGTEFWTSCALFPNQSAAGENPIFSFVSASGIEATVFYDTASQTFRAYRGNKSTLLGTSSVVSYPYQSWGWINIRYVMHGSAGIMEVWFADTQVLNVTGANTKQNGGATSIIQIYYGTGTSTAVGNIDDWIINDTSGSTNTGRIADCRIIRTAPTSDATPNDGTPSTGSTHYTLVDEVGYGNTDYVDIPNTSGKAEMFGFASLGITPSSIKALKVSTIVLKTDTDTMTVTPTIKSSGTGADGASANLSTSPVRYNAVFEVDPHTSAAWTASAVNSLTAGLKVA